MYAESEHNNRHIVVINAYALTQPVSEKHPEQRDNFYNELETILRTFRNRDELIIVRDLNAKTGGSFSDYPLNMGNFGKGYHTNSNGKNSQTSQTDMNSSSQTHSSNIRQSTLRPGKGR